MMKYVWCRWINIWIYRIAHSCSMTMNRGHIPHSVVLKAPGRGEPSTRTQPPWDLKSVWDLRAKSPPKMPWAQMWVLKEYFSLQASSTPSGQMGGQLMMAINLLII